MQIFNFERWSLEFIKNKEGFCFILKGFYLFLFVYSYEQLEIFVSHMKTFSFVIFQMISFFNYFKNFPAVKAFYFCEDKEE